MNTNNNTTIDTLIQGYQQFKTKHFDQSTAFANLVQYGQQPNTLVIACCDSRVDPAIVTNCQPGELFVVRNVANLVPPCDNHSHQQHHGTSAALEFGVLGLHVSNIIVFGHSHCGGIRALMEKTDEDEPSDFISTWMSIAKPAKQRVLTDYAQSTLDVQAQHCEKESLIISLNNLTTFPWIKERVEQGVLALHGWYFDLNTGCIEAYQPSLNQFESLV
jgi:carbonic anhydrase